MPRRFVLRVRAPAPPPTSFEVDAEGGAYAITGTAADLVFDGLNAFDIDAEAGSYAVTGTDAGLIFAGDEPWIVEGFPNSPTAGSGGWFAQYPTAEVEFTDSLTGWTFQGENGGSTSIQDDGLSPTGEALRTLYGEDHEDGVGVGLSIYNGGFTSAQQIYIGVKIRWDSDYMFGSNAQKTWGIGPSGGDGAIIFINEGFGGGRTSPRYVFYAPTFYDTAGGGTSINFDWNVPDVDPPMGPLGTYYDTVEWQIQNATYPDENGRVRMWINNTLVMDYSNLSLWPASGRAFGESYNANTWGGGNTNNIDSPQAYWIHTIRELRNTSRT